MISCLGSKRDKAFLSMLYQTGARISEIGNLRMKDVNACENGYLINITISKTKERTPIVFEETYYISRWLTEHPFKNNPEDTLFY